MAIPEEARYVFMVKLNLIDPKDEDKFNLWYNTHHVRDLMSTPLFVQGWRTKEVPHPTNFGDDLQRFWAVYAIKSVTPFEPRPPRAEGTPADSTRPQLNLTGLRLATGHGRVLYNLVTTSETDDLPGNYWVRYEFDFEGTEEERAAFELDPRVSKMVAEPGIQRALQLRAEPHDNQTGPHPSGEYVEIFEVDAPEDITGDDRATPFSAEQRAAWPQITPRGRHTAIKLFELTAKEVAVND